MSQQIKSVKGRTKMKHDHAVTSNTPDVFSTVIGCRIKGVVNVRDAEHTIRVLVLDCGWGLALCDNGSHWTENPERVARHLETARRRLEESKRELQGILEMAGAK